MKLGLCCISLDLQDRDPPLKFQKITYKRFSELPREEALEILGSRILNNLIVTNETIRYCSANDLCYRLSSDLFPLITYEAAGVDLSDLPNHDDIQDAFDLIENTIKETKVRVSCHPDQFNVLASINEQLVTKTIDELNFFSSFMDRIGCQANHESPINIHIQNSKDGSREEIAYRFLKNFEKLDENCQKRLVVENDDKEAAWSVARLLDVFHPITKIPITYDSHHFRLNNPENLLAEDAAGACVKTWGEFKPLFHFSNGRKDNSDRTHSDYVYELHEELFRLDVDIDYEFKFKDLTIKKFKESYDPCSKKIMIVN